MDPDRTADQRLELLEDLEQIKRLKARYFRCVDEKRWDEIVDLFTPDARIAATSAAGSNPDSFLTSLRRLGEDGVSTFHGGHMPEIDVRSDGTASGGCAMSFYLEWRAGGRRTGVQGFRRYEDEFRKDDGRWRISQMVIAAVAADPMAADRHPEFPSQD
jgi:SnoaL-like protein